MQMSEARRFIRTFGFVYLALLVWSLNFERPEFRAWEVLKDPESEFFYPNLTVEMTEIGDLGFRAWIPSLQHPRAGLFSTDRYGFRNPQGIERPRVVLLGDSFVAGAGLRDDQTLAAQLGRLLGEPVYSLACETANSPSLYLSDPRFFEHPPRVVVFAPVNRLVMPLRFRQILPLNHRTKRESTRWTFESIAEELRRINQVLGRDNGLSRAMRYGYNGGYYYLFGHPNVIVADGEPAIALPLQEQKCSLTPEQRGLENTIASTRQFAEMIATRGATLIYAPIPDSGEVYPEFFGQDERDRCAQPSLFDLLVPEAEAAGLNALDLREVFRRNKTPYLYLRDDSHWNPRAVGLAAEALAEAIRPLLAEGEDPAMAFRPPESEKAPPLR
jgi:SGNH hydrolase-like domain, acetyltransferase AlgX